MGLQLIIKFEIKCINFYIGFPKLAQLHKGITLRFLKQRQ